MISQTGDLKVCSLRPVLGLEYEFLRLILGRHSGKRLSFFVYEFRIYKFFIGLSNFIVSKKL